jgi:hypothetical protein
MKHEETSVVYRPNEFHFFNELCGCEWSMTAMKIYVRVVNALGGRELYAVFGGVVVEGGDGGTEALFSGISFDRDVCVDKDFWGAIVVGWGGERPS